MSKTCKDCLHCSVDDDEVLCSGMPWHYPFGGSDTVTLDKEACKYFLERDKQTVFDQITQSIETLAEEFVDTLYDRVACEYRYYSMLTAEFYNSRDEAVAATIKELKKEYKK